MDHDQTPKWNSFEDEDDDSSEAPKRPLPKRFQLSLSEFLGIEKESDKETEDDPEDTGNERFRKLFKRLFPSIATKQVAPEAEPAFAFAESAGVEDDAELGLFEEYPEAKISPEELPETPIEASIAVPVAAEAIPTEPLERPEPTLAPPHPEVVADVPPTPLPEALAATTPIEAPVAAAVRPVVPEVPRANTQERRGSGAAIVLALGVDILSRLRDRRIKRELKRTKRELERQKKDLENTKRVAKTNQESLKSRLDRKEHLERAEKRSAAQLEAALNKPAKQEKPVVEKSPKPTPNPERPPVPKPEQVKIKASEKKVQAKPQELAPEEELEPIIEAQQLKRQRSKTERIKELHIPLPEKEEVEVVPERYFERRHEVLDEPGHAAVPTMAAARPVITSPTPIAAVLSQKAQDSNMKLPATEDTNHTKSGSLSLPSDGLYRQSINYGIGAAFALMVLGLIAYSLF